MTIWYNTISAYFDNISTQPDNIHHNLTALQQHFDIISSHFDNISTIQLYTWLGIRKHQQEHGSNSLDHYPQKIMVLVIITAIRAWF
jgi:hypothetical protein